MTKEMTVEGIKELLFYGGPRAELRQTLVHRPDNAASIQLLYQLAIRHGVISPRAAREVLPTLPQDAGTAEARTLLESVLAKGDFLAVRVVR
ncbi:MAG: hypothetical protein K0041_01555 [Acidithiobacillus sp.]|nr:hypothetical protein [Acidithiobacillus sp.]